MNPVKGQRGFSLLETLVAVAILGLLGTGLLSALGANAKAAGIIDEQVTATNLAAAYLEALKELPYAEDYPGAGDGIVIPPQYAVTLYIQYSSDGATWESSYSGQKLQKISIVVSREGGKPVLSVCTFRTQR
jgi:prepilin-type N-terminal cleavage/methylation domain-containing protein